MAILTEGIEISTIFVTMPTVQGIETLCRPHLPILLQDHTHPEEHITTCYDSNPGFKLCSKKLYRYQRS